MRKKQNTRRKAEQWQAIIKDQEMSTQGVASYCREKSLSDKSFYAWRKRLFKQRGSSGKDFIEVSSLNKNVIEPLRIRTPGGYCVEVSPGTASSLLKDVIRMLELK